MVNHKLTLYSDFYTCIPPTPITKSSWPIKRLASRLSNVVPASDFRSENRLKHTDIKCKYRKSNQQHRKGAVNNVDFHFHVRTENLKYAASRILL